MGLIGGSFSFALYKKTHAVYVWNRTRTTAEEAIGKSADGLLTQDTLPLCELVILAGYPEFNELWLSDHADQIASGAVVIDTGGIKRHTCKTCFALAKGKSWDFVGCHPMAGTEHSGYAHAKGSMFHRAPMVVVPPEDASEDEKAQMCARLESLLKPCGFASFRSATASFHDAQIAYTSQLAHVVSNAYVKSPAAQSHKGFSAGSYKDLTRVAKLNPTMWCELFFENKDNLSNEIQQMIDHLQEYLDALNDDDRDRMYKLLEEGVIAKKEAERP